MKKLLTFPCFVFYFSLATYSQTINTVGGNHVSGYSGDGGPATNAELHYPGGVSIDGLGNIYISDVENNVVREVNSTGVIATIAGNYSFGQGFSGDGGPATNAELYLPSATVIDGAGNIYIVENGNSDIRKISTAGIISTFAGNHEFGAGYSGDGGPATAAELNYCWGISIDSLGSFYIADTYNNVIRKVNSSGIISTFAGNHAFGAGFSGDGGPATLAELNQCLNVNIDKSGNVYIADRSNNVIRKVNSSGIISTYAGNHTLGGGYSGDNGPATAAELFIPEGVDIDGSGNLYIADDNNNVIRKVNRLGIITTVAGNYAFGQGFSGDGGPATNAELWYPIGVTVSKSGNLYITDLGNEVIREVVGTITSIKQSSGESGQIEVFPNPSSGIFQISNPEINSGQVIEVYNVLGENVSSILSPKSQMSFNLTNQPNGVYFYRVLGNDKTEVGNGKLIIQK